jgi:hypothetical protein
LGAAARAIAPARLPAQVLGKKNSIDRRARFIDYMSKYAFVRNQSIPVGSALSILALKVTRLYAVIDK